jgi:hypothetical protein
MRPALKWALLVLATCATTAFVSPRLARSADHLDGPAVKTDPSTDIADLYTWVDGPNVVYVLTVFPQATSTAKFSDAASYVIHTSSGAAFGQTTKDTNIICQFDATQKITCWAGTSEYVAGDASQPTGLTSKDGKLTVFAGLRKDPFFFNLEGFGNERDFVVGQIPTLSFDVAGCPKLDPAVSLFKLAHGDHVGGTPRDFFKDLNVLAIVVSVDKTVMTEGGPILSAWASTNKKQ